MVNSRAHGIVRHWAADGAPLGESEFVHGTGMFRSWYDNGKIKGEIDERDGIPHGRMRAWDEAGDLIVEKYFVLGKAVSKKKYMKLAKSDPTLPKYQEDGQLSWEERTKHLIKAVKSDTSTLDSNGSDQAFLDQVLSEGKHAEALTWLKEDESDQNLRTLGEGMSNTESIQFVEDLYSRGAEEVLAIQIEIEPEGFEYTGKLIVGLSDHVTKRRSLFEVCNRQAIEVGFSPEEDYGQKYLFIALD